MPTAFVICLLGAESAACATLAAALAQALAATGSRTALIPAQPSAHADAAELAAQVDAARWGHAIVVVHQPADADARLARTDLTLLLALDPATASATQRQLDAELRGALLAAKLGWSVIGGSTTERLQAALAAHAGELRRRQPVTTGAAAGWRHACGRCGDPDCERHDVARARHG